MPPVLQLPPVGPNLAFPLQRGSLGKGSSGEILAGSWEGRGSTGENGGEGGLQAKLIICLLTSPSICQPFWRPSVDTGGVPPRDTPSRLTNLSTLPLTCWFTLGQLLTFQKPVSSSAK